MRLHAGLSLPLNPEYLQQNFIHTIRFMREWQVRAGGLPGMHKGEVKLR